MHVLVFLGLAIGNLLVTLKFYVSVSTNFGSSCTATLGTECASCDSSSAAWTPAGASYSYFAFSKYYQTSAYSLVSHQILWPLLHQLFLPAV
jgi:trehalose-6-phosphate synthase